MNCIKYTIKVKERNVGSFTNYQYTGSKYVEVCNLAKEISDRLKENRLSDSDLLIVDYFLWDEILPLAEKNISPINERKQESLIMSAKETKSIHDEIKGYIVEIGRFLGFDSRAEQPLATWAKRSMYSKFNQKAPSTV